MNASCDQPQCESPKGPRFYREFLAERDEILRNKWFLSQDAGHDVGFDVALIDWVTKHREIWLAKRSQRVLD